MKIIFVAIDSNRKSVAFVSDSGQVFSSEEAIRLARAQALGGVSLVRGKYGSYIRSSPNGVPEDNLGTLSISGRDIILYINQIKHAASTPPISAYLERYLASLDEGEPFIVPVGQKKVLVADIKEKFMPHLAIIALAAKELRVDQYLLGAILVDEIARMYPFERILDFLGARIVGVNVSVGIGQVKLDTAHQLIRTGLYNPNTNDKKLLFSGIMSNDDRKYLYEYLIEPKHNIRFAAARMRDLIDGWMRVVDISRKFKIIATLYHLIYKKPHLNPASDERGNQVATEFYELSKRWLSS